jgi:RHS repeat-associated protein
LQDILKVMKHVNNIEDNRLQGFYHNHIGSGSMITNSAGTVEHTLHYTAFGETLLDNAINYQTPYQFAGYERDGESGLNYAEARYYRKDIFISTDPMWAKYPGLTSYNYCGNNPINRIDPDGNFDFDPTKYSDKQLADMGLTRSDLDKFSQIVNNISNIVDSKVMDAISNTTGLNKETIMSDIQAGQGPTVSITPNEQSTHGNLSDGIVISSDVIKYMSAMYDRYEMGDKESFAYQVAGIALTILHEYGHIGDQITNGGNNSGQYITENGVKINYADVPSLRQNSIHKGKQSWNNGMTGTGHRGFDIEHYGFGLQRQPDIDLNGKIGVPNGEKSGIPMLNIFEKLNIK